MWENNPTPLFPESILGEKKYYSETNQVINFKWLLMRASVLELDLVG